MCMSMHVLLQGRMSARTAAATDSSNHRAPPQMQRDLPAAIRSAFIVGVRFRYYIRPDQAFSNPH